MSRTDLISDVFTIIRNAVRIKRQVVNVPASGAIKSIAEIFTGFRIKYGMIGFDSEEKRGFQPPL